MAAIDTSHNKKLLSVIEKKFLFDVIKSWKVYDTYVVLLWRDTLFENPLLTQLQTIHVDNLFKTL